MFCTKRVFILVLCCFAVSAMVGTAVAADDKPSVATDARSFIQRTGNIDPADAVEAASERVMNQLNLVVPNVNLPAVPCVTRTNQCGDSLNLYWLYDAPRNDTVSCGSFQNPFEALDNPNLFPETLKVVNWYLGHDPDSVGNDGTPDLRLTITADDAGLPDTTNILAVIDMPFAVWTADGSMSSPYPNAVYGLLPFDLSAFNIVIPLAGRVHAMLEVSNRWEVTRSFNTVSVFTDEAGEDGLNCIGNSFHGGFYRNRSNFGDPALDTVCFGGAGQIRVYAWFDDLFGPENWAMNWETCPEFPPSICDTYADNCLDLGDLGTTLGLCFFMPSGVSARKAAVAEFRGGVVGQPCTLKTVAAFICDWSTTTYDTLGAIVDIGTAVDVDVVIFDGAGVPGTEIARKTLPGATVQANWLAVAYSVWDFTADNIVLPPGGQFYAMVEVAGARLGDPGFTMSADIGAFDPANCGAPEIADYMMYVDDTDGTVDPGDTTFITLVDAFAYDLGWGINVDLCCAPSDFALCTPAADPNWETQGNGIGRTNATTASISSLCGLVTSWSVDLVGNSRSMGPVIADGQVIVTHTDAISVYDKATGALNWTNGAFPFILGDLKGVVTAADSGVYAAGAGARSFTKYHAVTGVVIWSRNATTVPLDDPNGQLNWTSSIVTGGHVYFTQESGNVYKLDATTGVTAGFMTLPDFPDANTYNAMCSDGTKLWVGSYNVAEGQGGSIFQIDMATMAIDWQLQNPSFVFTGDPVFYTPEGFLSGLAYDAGVLYYNSLMAPVSDAFPQTGAVGAIDVAVEDGTGGGILWVNDVVNAAMSSPGFSPTSGVTLSGGPSIGPGMVYTASYGRWGGTTEPDGIAAWNKTLGLRSWYMGYGTLGVSGGVPVSDDVRSDNSPTVICQPDGTPYLFTGHVDGTHRLLEGNTGARLWYRTMSGRTRQTAVGEDCIAVVVRNGNPTDGGGSLVLYVVGDDRPRLQIDSQFVFRTATPLDGSVNDNLVDVLQNTGCIDLNISGYTVVNPPAVRVTSINPNLAAVGRAATRNLGGYDRFLDITSDKDLAIARSVGALEEETEESLIRTFANTAGAAADPVFLTVNTAPGAVAAGATQSLDVNYDETGLTNNTGYTNYIEVASDDLDYFPQGALDLTGGVTTPGVPFITFGLFIGCPDASTIMTLGLGTAWITNWGAGGGGGNFSTPDSDDGFIIGGHDWHFDGGWAMVLQDSVHWAFEGSSVGGYPRRAGEWGPTLPCGVDLVATSYDSPLGAGADAVEEVTFNMIDLASTNGFFPPSSRQMGGVFMAVKRVGSQAADMGDFLVTEFKITNEAGDIGDIVGDMNDMYFGTVTDWDIGAGTDNFVYANAAGAAAYDGGVAGGGNAGTFCGHSRLDADAYGSGALGSGGAPTFMMGDIMNDQARGNRAMDMLSDPTGYGNSIDPASTANTDIGELFVGINIPTLADGATENFYMAIYQVTNGENGLSWTDGPEFEASVAEIQCRAAAFAGFGKGDVTCDGVIDLQDVVALGNIIDGLLDPTGTGGVYTADTNGDNVWNQADYDLLYDVVAGVQPASNLANGWRF